MKTLLALFLCCVIFLGCNNTETKVINPPETFSGKHPLHKMAQVSKDVHEQHEGTLTGSYFVIFGNVSGNEAGETSMRQTVTFSWRGTDSIYNFSTIALDNIRMRLTDSADTPFVTFTMPSKTYKFNVGNGYSDYIADTTLIKKGNISDLFTRFVGEVIITCKPSDWPQEINLPMQINKDSK